jgi:hypothetical protein
MNKAQLEKRKSETIVRAKAELAKTEIVQFRLDPENIMGLFELAELHRKPVGTMVREWVLEKMRQEQSTPLNSNLRSIENRLSALEKRIAKKA